MARLRTTVALTLAATGCGKQVPTPPPAAAPVVNTPAPAGTPPAGERVENPTYSAWAAHPVGTTVVQRSVAEELGNPNKTVTTIRLKLVERTDAKLTVELKTTTTRYDGVVIDNPPDKLPADRYYTLPIGATRPTPPKSEEREELTVSGRKYLCTLVRSKGSNEAGEVQVRTWHSDAMPGRLVKSVTEVPAVKKVVAVEVVEVVYPPAGP
jgi:hypothetical protein